MVRKLDCSLTGPDFRELSYQLLHKPNYLPDCIRDLKELTNSFSFMVNKFGEFMGIDNGGLKGFFFIGDVVPGHEGVFFSWFWGKFTHGDIRAIQEYLSGYSGLYGLCRIVARTADDKKHGRILEMCGMKLEGRFKSAFKSGGRLSTLYQYRRLFGGL